jgi:hypothetical protein
MSRIVVVLLIYHGHKTIDLKIIDFHWMYILRFFLLKIQRSREKSGIFKYYIM